MKKIVVFFAIVLLLFACFEQNNQIVEEQSIAVQFMKSAEIDVTSAKCIVTADDMDTMEVNLIVTPTMISGEIQGVPYGDDRLFEIMCYNSNGNMNYYGSALVDINSLAPVVDIILYHVDSSANVTIRGTFADTEETEEKIVFVADWSGNYDTYIMDIDGTNIKKLTDSPYGDNCPELSPDRQKVVYQRPSEVGHQAFIVDVNTLEVEMLPLVEYIPHMLSWSPNGNKLMFWSIIHGMADVFIYDIETDSVTCVIEDSARNWGARYTPDGEQFVYHSDKTGIFRAYIANLDGSDQHRLCVAENVEERSPHVHPTNNNLIVFAGRGYDANSSVQWGVFIYDRSTSSVSKVISNSGVDENRPSWSPDGNTIMYEEFDGINRGLYLIDPDGSDRRVLIDTNGNEMYPHWR